MVYSKHSKRSKKLTRINIANKQHTGIFGLSTQVLDVERWTLEVGRWTFDVGRSNIIHVRSC